MSALILQLRRELGWGCGEHLLLWGLSSRAIATCTEALLPGKLMDIACWREIENKYFDFICFPMCFAFALLNYLYPDPWVLFHLISSLSVMLRRGEIEQLGGHLASSQHQATTTGNKSNVKHTSWTVLSCAWVTKISLIIWNLINLLSVLPVEKTNS